MLSFGVNGASILTLSDLFIGGIKLEDMCRLSEEITVWLSTETDGADCFTSLEEAANAHSTLGLYIVK